MDLCIEPFSACLLTGQPSGHVAKTLTLDIEHKLFNQIFHACHVYRYHFIPLSLTFTSPGGHKVSAKQNLLAIV